jgi:hypothetical protein
MNCKNIKFEEAKWKLFSIGLIVFTLFAVTIIVVSEQLHNNQIQQWAEEHDYRVESIERVWFLNDSPFWRFKNDEIFRATVVTSEGKRISFFRFRGWWYDQAWKE